MSTPLRLGLGTLLVGALVYGALGTTGCVVVTDSTSDAGDTGYVDDTGTTDTGITDTGTDTALPSVIIPGAALLGDDALDFGGGSSKADIVTNKRIAYAVAKVGATESGPIGKDASGTIVNGKLTGLTPGVPVTITVTGYLRGLTGKNADPANERIPWAVTTCTATPSASADVTAACNKLALITDLKGIVVTSDVLPSGYCAGKGATDFEELRARTPFSGSAIASRYVTDCYGVIFIPFADFSASEVGGVSEWSLSLGSKSSSTACTSTAPCRVDRKTSSASPIDLYVVGSECGLNTSTAAPTTCF